MNTDWIENLNPPQQRAVTHHTGPLLVLAGAGSGKTRVLTHRVAYLIDHFDTPPEAIVAVTFTNRAAAEMRHRVDALLDDKKAASRVVISTFHSLGARLLRRFAPRARLSWNFSIYDDSDSRRLIGALLESQGLEKDRASIRHHQNYIDSQKNRALTPNQALEQAFDGRAEEDAQFYELYQKALREADAVDFGDLIMGPVNLFRQSPELALHLSESWQFLMVDEFQDTNPAQYELLDHLTTAHDNLAVVGDDDQAIYGWRGADPTHILGFEDAFRSANIVKLEQNYRSTAVILDAANDVIAHNSHRHSKRLWTDRPDGDPIVVFSGADDREEAGYVAETIFDLLRRGTDAEDIAIFYRTNAQGRLFEEQMRQWGVAYRIVGGLSFYAREEIKDLLAYLRAALNPSDDVATARVINTPRRGVGKSTIEKLRRATAVDGVFNLQEAALLANDNGPGEPPQSDLFTARPLPSGPDQVEAIDDIRSLRGVSRRGLTEFQTILEATREDLLHFDSLTPVMERLMERTAYADHVQHSDPERADDRLRNIGELVNAIEEFELDPGTPALIDAVKKLMPDDADDPLTTSEAAIHLRAFLDRSALVQSTDTNDDTSAVTLMTIHGSKGLEFDHVFLVGMEEDTFPNLRNPNDPEELAEERRLAYVAITRARNQLYISNARRRRTYGQFRNTEPSRFLLHIDSKRLLVDPRSTSAEIDYAARTKHSSSGRSSTKSPSWSFDQSSQQNDDFNQAPPDWDQSYDADVAALLEPPPVDTAHEKLVGLTVSHTKFGVGEVLSASGSGDNPLLIINFPAVGEQSVYRKFLKILG